MGMVKFEPCLDSADCFAELGVSNEEAEGIRQALERVIDEGVEAIRQRLMDDRVFEENAKSCGIAAGRVGDEYRVINGDAWCRCRDCRCYPVRRRGWCHLRA